MAKVIILEKLKQEILKKFKGESKIIFRQMSSLGDNLKKGKFLGSVGGVVIKELRYKSFRFYFLVAEEIIKILNFEDINDLLIKFVRMSDKKSQQETINEIREVLIKLGTKGF